MSSSVSGTVGMYLGTKPDTDLAMVIDSMGLKKIV
jgi:hypothetical protein